MDYKEREAIRKAVKLLRTSKKIGIRELGRKAGVSKDFIRGLENGTGNLTATKIDLISYICDAMGTNLFDMIMIAQTYFPERKLKIREEKYKELARELRMIVLENNGIL